jgi:16S rRNA (cytidine1402-2'-O)-methyltransferase
VRGPDNGPVAGTVAGTLWLVGTPIGNLGDVTERARRVLSEVEVIACEDTRRTRGLLNHLEIPAPRLVSFFEGNEERRVEELMTELRSGRSVALVTDAGMPAVSDPGYRLVAACADQGIPVDAAPGPSAPVTALALSGLPTDRFAFEGFLPRRAGERRRRLEALAAETRTVVLFESPRRLPALLREASEVLGDRRAALARELTKRHQEVVRGSLSELAERFAEPPKGEVVVVIEGAETPVPADLSALADRVRERVEAGASRKDAVARVAEEAGVSRRALYEESLRGGGGRDG